MTWIAAPLMIAGTLVSAAGQYQQGQSQAAALEYQQKIQTQAAQEEVAAGSLQGAQQYRKTSLALSGARAAAGASGVNPAGPTPVKVAGDIAKFGTLNALTDIWNAKTRATTMLEQGDAYGYEAGQARTAGDFNAVSTLISGGENFYSKFG